MPRRLSVSRSSIGTNNMTKRKPVKTDLVYLRENSTFYLSTRRDFFLVDNTGFVMSSYLLGNKGSKLTVREATKDEAEFININVTAINRGTRFTEAEFKRSSKLRKKIFG